MSVNLKKAGDSFSVYRLGLLSNQGAEVTIHHGNETEKKAYLKHFLELNRDQDVFFVDDLTGTMYNKNYIISCKEKENTDG